MSAAHGAEAEVARIAQRLPESLRLSILPSAAFERIITFESRYAHRPDFYLPIVKRTCALSPFDERFNAVVVDGTEEIVASARSEPMVGRAPSVRLVRIHVSPGLRGRGIGAALADLVATYDAASGASLVLVDVPADSAAGLALARARGMREIHRRTTWYLELTRFDPTGFEDPDVVAERAGVVLTHANAERDRLGTQRLNREIHRLHSELLADIPVPPPAPVFAFADYERLLLTDDLVIPSATTFVRRGDHLIGLTLILAAGPDLATSIVTGTIGAARGRRLSLALKLRAIAELRQHGFAWLSTTFDVDNHPMLRIIKRLGYQPAPEMIRFERPL